MPQEEDFFNPEQPSFEVGDEQEVAGPDKNGKGGSRSRILLLVLLLLVIVAAALFYVGPGLFEPEIAQTPAPPPKKKIVKLDAPKPPAKTQPAEKVEPPAEKVEPPAEKVEPPAEKVEPPAEKGVAKEEVPEQPVAAVEMVESPAEVPPAEEKVEPLQTVAPSPVAAGKYVLQAGAYLLESNLRSVKSAVEKLGYQPRLEKDTRIVEMTRLKLGSYEKVAGQARLDEIRSLAPSAFAIWHDGQMTVYAGSYYSLDRARAFADRLYSEGVRVEEEAVEVAMPITIVRFGTFEDRSEAERIASQARDAGLEVAVVENR